MKNILVPTELGEKSKLPLKYAANFGASSEAEITLFNVAIKEEDTEESNRDLTTAKESIKSHNESRAVTIQA